MNLHQLRNHKRLFDWSTFQPQFTKDATKVFALIPLLGYLILFNDTISNQLSFETLTGSGNLFFDTATRIRFIYFGFLFVGIGWAIFRIRAPATLQKFNNFFDYRDFALKHFRFLDFVGLFREIETSHGYGKYDDTQFSRDDYYDFIQGSVPELATAELSKDDDDQIWHYAPGATTFPHAIDKHREFLSDLLSTEFMILNGQRYLSMCAANLCFVFGVILIALPAFDVFLAICFDLFGDLTI